MPASRRPGQGWAVRVPCWGLPTLIKRRVLRVEGDLHPFMANLLYFKALMAAPRARPAVLSTALSTALPEAS